MKRQRPVKPAEPITLIPAGKADPSEELLDKPTADFPHVRHDHVRLDGQCAESDVPEAVLTSRLRKRKLRASRNEGEHRPFVRSFVTFLALAAPALWMGTLIFLYGVDTPWGDQWDTGLLLEKFRAGTLGLGDFFAFHSEHRIFFPRLIAFGLAQLTHWNIRAELLMIWILACVCSVNIWRIAQATGGHSVRNRHWLLLAANVLLFSPSQWENFLWGFQIAFLLPLACITACLWMAPSLRHPFDFLATLLLCLISTFSVASGFACWWLTAPLLIFSTGKRSWSMRKTWWLIWLTFGLASIYFYFHGYTQSAIHPSPLEALRHPLRAIQFTLAYLGYPFSSGTALDASCVAQLAGAALVICLAACLLYLWRCRLDGILLADALPWVALAALALASGFLTMLGRLGFGIPGAMQSRYVSFAIMLPIGLLFLVSLIFKHWRSAFPGINTTSTAMGLVSLATALSLLFLCASIKSLETWESFQHDRLSGKAALLLINIVDEPETLAQYVHRRDPAVRARANFLDRIGYLHPHLLRSNQIRGVAYRSNPGTNGEVKEFAKFPTGECEVAGWAILPDKHRIADGVLLTYDNAAGDSIIFALADVKYPRPDVSEQLKDKAYLRCAWAKSWKAEQIPSSVRLIKAWAFDAEDCRAFPIGSASM